MRVLPVLFFATIAYKWPDGSRLVFGTEKTWQLSLPVRLIPVRVETETGWSRAGVSTTMTIDFLTMGLAGFGWGALSDKFGTCPVVLSGAVLLGLGLCLASRATSLLQFQRFPAAAFAVMRAAAGLVL
jgi:MFS family permease